MTPGLRTFKSASLRVAIAEALPKEMRDQTRELLSVQSGNPRKGQASKLMWAVCKEADAWWLTLLVNVKSFDDGMSDEQLRKWYARFGFEVIQDDPCLMSRSPR